MRRHLHIADGLRQNEVFVFVGKGSALIVEYQIHLAKAQRVVQVLMVAAHDVYRHGGIRLGERGNGAGKLIAVVGDEEAHRQRSGILVVETHRLAAKLLQVGGDDKAAFVEVLARLGQFKAPAFSPQQLDAQLVLQRFDLLGDGGLRNMMFFRREGKAVVSHDGLEVFDLPKEHEITAFESNISYSRGKIHMCDGTI